MAPLVGAHILVTQSDGHIVYVSDVVSAKSICAEMEFVSRIGAHGARSNVHHATVASSHALCASEAAGIYAALAMPRTLAVTRRRVHCHSGRQKVGEIVHLAVFVVTAPMAPGPMCTKRPWLRPMPSAPAKQQAYT